MAGRAPDSATCWFCGARLSSSVLRVPIYRPIPTRGTGRRRPAVEFDVDTVHVPRCPQCRTAHTRARWSAVGFAGVGAVAGMVAFAVVQSRVPHGNRLGAVMGLGMVFMGYSAGDRLGRTVFLRGTRPESVKAEYPLLETRRAEGWRIGNRPGQQRPTDSEAGGTGPPKPKRRRRKGQT